MAMVVTHFLRPQRYMLVSGDIRFLDRVGRQENIFIFPNIFKIKTFVFNTEIEGQSCCSIGKLNQWAQSELESQIFD
jgi:hypothetical protein